MDPRGRGAPSRGPSGLRSFWPYLVLIAGVAILLVFSMWLPAATSEATSPATAVALAPTINPTILAIGTPQPGQAFVGSGVFQGNELQIPNGTKYNLNGRYAADGAQGVVKGAYAPDLSINVESVRVYGEDPSKVGKPAPDINSGDFKLSSLRGKKVLVYFAASPG